MIQVREYAVLTSDTSKMASLDVGVVSPATITWLKELQRNWSDSVPMLADQNSQSVKLSSYVGYLQSPGGEAIEILPKTHRRPIGDRDQLRNRLLLRRMLASALHLSPREAGAADLDSLDTPIHEWVFSRFLAELSSLVKRGLKFDYQQTEEESRFLRGQLDQVKQMRRTPEKLAHFHIRHDIYSPERVENRLLKTAVTYVLALTTNAENWRMANELKHLMLSINQSLNPLKDLPRWSSGKLMRSYQSVRPWCQIVLEKLNPAFQAGLHRGVALLFPMEKLFESYVFERLRKQLDTHWFLKSQAASRYLVTHCPNSRNEARPWFQLKPDLLLERKGERHVLDSKWKLLDSSLSRPDKKYNLSQADFYQLFAYGHKYMDGFGDMMMIYPRNDTFAQPLPVFEYDTDLRLWIVPFDLEAGVLVDGAWSPHFPINGTFSASKVAHI